MHKALKLRIFSWWLYISWGISQLLTINLNNLSEYYSIIWLRVTFASIFQQYIRRKNINSKELLHKRHCQIWQACDRRCDWFAYRHDTVTIVFVQKYVIDCIHTCRADQILIFIDGKVVSVIQLSIEIYDAIQHYKENK